MRISKVTIENFGIYKDLCEFEFKYDPQKKVTLLKGENGSGKTTLLNSIKTVLYGPMLYGSKKNNNQKYMDFINQMLNTEAKKNPSAEFGVAIEITTNLPNFSGTFKIIRSWHEQNKKTKEKIEIYSKGNRLTESEITEFFNVFYRMYPLELFELYYLDGEKIDQLSFFDGDIYKLIETSMNIDLFKTLKADLENYAVKKHNSKELSKLKDEKDYLSEFVENLEEKNSDCNDQVSRLENEEKIISLKVERLSKEISESNQNLPEMIRDTNEEIKTIKKDLQRQMVDLIPILLLENEIGEMKLQLAEEQKDAKAKLVKELINEDLKKEIVDDSQSVLEIDQIDKIFSLIQKRFSHKIEVIHDVNNDDYQGINTLISRIQSDSQKTVVSLFEKYYALQKKVRKLNESMGSYDANRINVLLEELLESNQELQKIQYEIKELKRNIQVNQNQIDSSKNKIANLDSEIWKAIKTENVSEVVNNMKEVINAYIDVVKARKIKGIEEHTKEMFGNLIRKKSFVKHVRITDESIYLETMEGNNLLVNNLSSGERQLFVLSIIYALFKVSERSTPLIFDTLLGRLDKTHQQEVMSKFISSCPDQVIILATDSELENIKPETLAELVNTKHTIDFSKESNRIEVMS